MSGEKLEATVSTSHNIPIRNASRSLSDPIQDVENHATRIIAAHSIIVLAICPLFESWRNEGFTHSTVEHGENQQQKPDCKRA